jgi:hypothetical protein
MKKIILTWAVMLTIGLATAFAGAKDGISENAIAAFKNDFAAAKNVSWAQGRNYLKASFSLNNKVMYAFYNYHGDLVAVVHHILSTDLPQDLSEQLKKDYGNFWISDLFELSSDEQHVYYVTLENGDGSVALKSDGKSGWSLYKRIK